MTNKVEPFKAIEEMLAFNSRDWALNKADAWLWGIVHGWDGDDGDESAMLELAAHHGWSSVDVKRLRDLHTAWEEAKGDCPSGGVHTWKEKWSGVVCTKCGEVECF